MRSIGLLFTLIFIVANSVNAQEINEYRKQYIEKTKKEFPNTVQSFYDIDSAWNFNARFKKIKKGKTISLPTSGTVIKDYVAYAKVTFKHEGKKHHFIVYRPTPVLPLYRNHLFLLIKDQTAPNETYGGGRYMDLNIKDFEGKKVNIDFNKLYNPYCAFSDGWNCPIPPKNNHLKLKIEAGEKLPLKTEYDNE